CLRACHLDHAVVGVVHDADSVAVARDLAEGRSLVLAVRDRAFGRDLRDQLLDAGAAAVHMIDAYAVDCCEEFEAAVAAAPVKLSSRPLSIRDLGAIPTRRSLWKPVITAGSRGSWNGPTGSLKTSGTLALAVERALAKANGGTFLGLRVERGVTLILAGEAVHGYRNRLRAAVGTDRFDDPDDEVHDRIFVAPSMPNLMREESLHQFVRYVEELPEEPDLIIADTWSRWLGVHGLDESRPADVARMLGAVDTLCAEIGDPSVLFVCHPGHATGGRERGASNFPAAMDFRVEQKLLGKPRDLRARLTFTKVKDSEPPAPIDLTFEVMHLGVDQDGDPVTSLRLAAFATAGRSCSTGSSDPDAGLSNVLAHLKERGPSPGKALIGLLKPLKESAAYAKLKGWGEVGKLGKQDKLYTLPGEASA
ncbi:MAG: AAA family ATPase, partial [Planctomycetes bacterium]|nr:AAA family ATPase [Planctomycetota bacterium]